MSDSQTREANVISKTPQLSKINVVRIALFHLSGLLVFWVGLSWIAFAVFVLSFVIRTFGIAAGYHRYFSHRAFTTTRKFQFALAWLGASAGQKGPLSWATSHRLHHRTSDTAADPHSPQKGFFFGYLGWLLPVGALPTDLELTSDLAKFPELLWLNRNHNVGPLSVIVNCGALGFALDRFFPGLRTSAGQLIVWGFILSTLAILHGTMLINTVCHLAPHLRATTNDHSRNVAWLLPLNLGENYHHNHHRYPKSSNCAIDRYQIDFIYLGICALEKLGLVTDVKSHGPAIDTEQPRLKLP